MGVPDVTTVLVPDVVILDRSRDRLLLVNVANHGGPIDDVKAVVLRAAFCWWRGQVALVTIFRDRQQLARYDGILAWGSAAWFAQEPAHLIVFGDDRVIWSHSRRGRGVIPTSCPPGANNR